RGTDAFLVPYGDRLEAVASVYAPSPSTPLELLEGPQRPGRATKRPTSRGALWAAIAVMPPADRRLLYAVTAGGTQVEIGRELGVSQQAVSLRVARALERLARLLFVAAAIAAPRCLSCSRMLAPSRHRTRRARAGHRCASCAAKARWAAAGDVAPGLSA
ncbi:MAG: sigma factor-like helix-turn-helix DNA-binding protein, partial [Polyangiaceae bacterium]